MTTVKEVLDQLGRPPADICVDWVWQLRDFKIGDEESDCTAHHEPVQVCSQRDQTQPHVVWSQITTDPQGVLRPSPSNAKLTKKSLDELIVQLQHWSNANASNACVRTNLTQRATSSKLSPKKRRHHSFLAVRYIAASACLLSIALLLGSWMLSGQSSRPQSQTTSMSMSTIVGSSASTSTVGVPGESAKPGRQGLTTVAVELDAMHQSLHSTKSSTTEQAATESPLAHIDSLQRLTQNLDSATGSASSVESPQTSVAAISPANGTEQSIAPSIAPIATSESGSPQSEPMIDVLGELADLAQSAEVELVEQLVASASTTGADASTLATVSPPLVLTVSPPHQLQRFDKSIRPRQPAWKLRLSVSDGFTAEPPDAQMIEGREWASWMVREERKLSTGPRFNAGGVRSNPLQTQVMVQVQLANQRQTSLRWRIVAGANDFPGLAIPLDQTWLDGVQTHLRTQTQWLFSESERARTLARVQGLPSEARSSLTTRRRALEAEHKLATRWLEIIADANQFPGWLDGQLNVHAQLLDAAHSPSPTLLQFGNP